MKKVLKVLKKLLCRLKQSLDFNLREHRFGALPVLVSRRHTSDFFAACFDFSHSNLVTRPTVAELLLGKELDFFFAEFVELFRANRSGCEEVSEAGVKPLESRAGFKTGCVKCDVVFFFVHISHNGNQYIRISGKVNNYFQLFICSR
mgnify:CR=1 FL=1